jgi:outer membrane protein
MKRYVSMFFGILCVCVFPLSATGADSDKIGVVDLQKCIRDSIVGKKLFQELKDKKDSMQKQIDQKQSELLKLKDEFEKQSMMLSMDAKEDKEKDFERMSREFKFLYEDLTEEMGKAEAEARKKILGELEKVVADIGEKDGYLLIFERRTSGIMFLDKAIDISDEVIKAYDKTKQ